MRKTMQVLSQFGKLLDKLPEHIRVAPVGRAISLSYEPGRAATVSDKQWQTHKAFFANESNLHRFSVRLDSQN
jgi:hypothetical protein